MIRLSPEQGFALGVGVTLGTVLAAPFVIWWFFGRGST